MQDNQELIMKKQLELIDIVEKAMRDYLEDSDLMSNETAQILIDVSANVLIKSVFRAILQPEHRIAYLNQVFNTVIRQMESINTSDMLMGEFPHYEQH